MEFDPKTEFLIEETVKLTSEKASTMIQELAISMAMQIGDDVSGREALIAFAAAIKETNFELYNSAKAN